MLIKDQRNAAPAARSRGAVPRHARARGLAFGFLALLGAFLLGAASYRAGYFPWFYRTYVAPFARRAAAAAAPHKLRPALVRPLRN